MPKPPRLAVDPAATELRLFGRRKADRFDDAALEVLGDFTNAETVWLFGQHITRIPPSLAKLTKPFSLHLGSNAALKSLAGIEQLVHLRAISLYEMHVDLEHGFELLAGVPELVSVELMPRGPIPKAIGKLHSVLEVKLNMKHGASLERTLKRLATLATLRSLAIDKHVGPLPSSLGALAALERLRLRGSSVTMLPATIGKLARLKLLDAHFNKIKLLPDELFDCTALEELDLCYNPIKQLSPRIAKLTRLVSLDLALTHVTKFPPELGTLSALRTLRIANKVKQLPAPVLALQLDHFDGPPQLAKQFTLRDVETPDDDEVVFTDEARLPADFGRPQKLVLRMQNLARPLPQLAKLTTVRELELEYIDPALVLPHVGNPQHVQRLSIIGEGTTPLDVSRFTSLVRLGVDWVPEHLDVTLPDLEELWVRAKGARLALATPKLRSLTLIHTTLPDYAVLASLPLTKLELRGVPDVDAKRLFRALAGKPLERLDLMWTTLGTLPPELALLDVRELELGVTKIASVPAELAQLTNLRSIAVSKRCSLAKQQLPPGRWKKRVTRDELRYDRTD